MSDVHDSEHLETAEPAPAPLPEPDEFAGLEPAPVRRSPILALSIIALASFTIFHLRHDLRYALSPKQVVPAAELTGAGASAVGRYVEVTGIPDRHDSLYIEARGGKERETLFRLLDTEPPVFVRARDTLGAVELTSTWKGRLQRFDDVAWASSLHDYFAKTPQKSVRALDLVSLRGHLADASVALHDRRGRALPLDASAELVVVDKPSEYALFLSREKFPKKDDAERELARALAQRPSTPKPTAGEDSPDSFVFYLPFEKDAAKQNELMALLEKENIDIEAHAPSHKATLGTLAITDWDAVSEVHVEEAVVIGESALVLTEGESPEAFTWALFVAVLMLGLGAWNVWYLVRPRRR